MQNYRLERSRTETTCHWRVCGHCASLFDGRSADTFGAKCRWSPNGQAAFSVDYVCILPRHLVEKKTDHQDTWQPVHILYSSRLWYRHKFHFTEIKKGLHFTKNMTRSRQMVHYQEKESFTPAWEATESKFDAPYFSQKMGKIEARVCWQQFASDLFWMKKNDNELSSLNSAIVKPFLVCQTMSGCTMVWVSWFAMVSWLAKEAKLHERAFCCCQDHCPDYHWRSMAVRMNCFIYHFGNRCCTFLSCSVLTRLQKRRPSSIRHVGAFLCDGRKAKQAQNGTQTLVVLHLRRHTITNRYLTVTLYYSYATSGSPDLMFLNYYFYLVLNISMNFHQIIEVIRVYSPYRLLWNRRTDVR